MRVIQPEIFKFIDDKLLTNGAAQHAIEIQDPRSLLIYAAEACVGIREVGGNNMGPLVQLIQKTADGKANREAWCMAGVQTWLAYVEKKLGVISPIPVGEHCLTVRNKTLKKYIVKRKPLPGAIIIWQHGTSTDGHTGIMTEWLGDRFEAVEANTESGVNPSGNIIRDGGGVYSTIRSRFGNGDMHVVDFLIPF